MQSRLLTQLIYGACGTMICLAGSACATGPGCQGPPDMPNIYIDVVLDPSKYPTIPGETFPITSSGKFSPNCRFTLSMEMYAADARMYESTPDGTLRPIDGHIFRRPCYWTILFETDENKIVRKAHSLSGMGSFDQPLHIHVATDNTLQFGFSENRMASYILKIVEGEGPLGFVFTMDDISSASSRWWVPFWTSDREFP